MRHVREFQSCFKQTPVPREGLSTRQIVARMGLQLRFNFRDNSLNGSSELRFLRPSLGSGCPE